MSHPRPLAAADAGLADGDEHDDRRRAGPLDVALNADELARARRLSPAAADEHVDVAIRKYAKLVGSAAEGAVAR